MPCFYSKAKLGTQPRDAVKRESNVLHPHSKVSLSHEIYAYKILY
jgi:hypothetical protein